MTIVLVTGWITSSVDVSYGRLALIPLPENIEWRIVLPPITLLIITRMGLPVSTTFMILSSFTSTTVISQMINKSI